MKILNVTYKCKTGKREAFLEAIQKEGIDSASRSEAGNMKYEYYFSADNNDELFLVEKWKDADAITFHFSQAHFKRLGELKAEFVLDTIIEKYDA
ncbi:MAG: antibiotic biosynthesis monooxygenase [Oribacterium sp.]|nr:antibiotic biosynthesis monooxygenase [Oribacterium sp.]